MFRGLDATLVLEDPDEFLRLASRAYNAGSYRRCRELVSKALLIEPASLEAHRWFARAAQQEQDWESALSSASTVLAATPGNEEAEIICARAFSALSRWSDAARAWNAIALAKPGSFEAWREVSHAAAMCGSVELASKAVTELQRLGRKDPEALRFAADAALDIGDLKNAVQLFREVVSLNRDQVSADLSRYLEKGRLRGAAVALCALRGKEDFPDEQVNSLSEALVRDAVHHERANAPLDAFKDYASAMLLHPEDAMLRAGYERALEAIVDSAILASKVSAADESHYTWVHLLRAGIGEPTIWRRAAEIFTKLKVWHLAEVAWSAILAQEPQDPVALLHYGRSLDYLEKWGSSVAVWRRLTAIRPDDPVAQRGFLRAGVKVFSAAREAFAMDRFAEAYRLFAAVPREVPQYGEVGRRLERIAQRLVGEMRTAFKEKRYSDTVSHAELASKIAPRNSEILRLWARSSLKQQDYDTVVDVCRRQLELDARDAKAHLVLGRACLGLKRYEEAASALAEAIARAPDDPAVQQLHCDLERRRSKNTS